MWVCLNDAFFSIVRKEPDIYLTVRARRRGDIERYWPDAEVTEGTGTDYRFRALISETEVAAVIWHSVTTLDYANFNF